MRLRSSIVIVILLLSYAMHAQPGYKLQYPFSQSAEAGASFHLLLHREISSFRNVLLPAAVFPDNRFVSRAGNVTYRLLLMGTLDFYMAYLPAVNQHEYFGHLGRAKQFNAGFTWYKICFFPPSGGIAYYGDHELHPLTDAERMVEMAGGIEANSVMADEISLNIMQGHSITFNTSMLFLGARSDLVTYLLFEGESSSNDIDQYLQVLNRERDPDARIEKNDLVIPATFSFLSSPIVLQVSYHLLRDYVLQGKEESELFLFNKGGRVKFLPFTGYTLTPNGPVISLGSYFTTGDQQYKLSIGHGLPWNIRRSEFTFSAYRIPLISNSLSADLDARCWAGEGFRMHGPDGQLISTGEFGGMAAIDLYYRLPVGSPAGRIPFFMGGVYAKTDGYTAGYRLRQGLGFRIAVGYYFEAAK